MEKELKEVKEVKAVRPHIIAQTTLGKRGSVSACVAMGRLVFWDGHRRTVATFDSSRPLTVTVSQ
jgi:hypothetical protein